ncbi:MAG: hypothetical protein ACYCV7_16125 [Acidimicrobiales bacterium]
MGASEQTMEAWERVETAEAGDGRVRAEWQVVREVAATEAVGSAGQISARSVDRHGPVVIRPPSGGLPLSP